ncbi:MAG TPA: aldo/keto reductase, partial [Burkholderiales bacterium]|nr:aldo/keto reductase [Burkholderiales bacterium]
MRQRQLGRSGVAVSEIGFGAWGIGGNKDGAVAYGPTDEAQSLDALSAAFDAGINFFDTADLYGFGESERLIGKAFTGRRDRVVIASKGGMLDPQGRQDFTPAHLATSLEESLKRLRTDYVDLYQLHGPGLDQVGALIGPMDALRREGKARAIGISLRAPEDGRRALDLYPFDAVQVNFNLLDQRAVDSGLMDLCRERGAGIIVRTPLCFGFLTGGYSATQQYDASDHRSRWNVEQRKVWASAYELFSGIKGRVDTPAQFALRFCLSFDAVSSVIPGMLTRAHVEENAAASQGPA